MAAECAKSAGEVGSRLKALVELLDPALPLSPSQRSDSTRQLVELLESGSLPEEKRPFQISLGELPEKDKEAEGLISTSSKSGFIRLESVFLHQELEFGSSTPFQVQLSAPENGSVGALEQLEFDSLQLFFQQVTEAEADSSKDQILCAIIKKGEKKVDVKTEVAHLGDIRLGDAPTEVQADLRWAEGCAKIFEGTLSAHGAGEVRVSQSGKLPRHLAFWILTLPSLSLHSLQLSHAILFAGEDRAPLQISLSPLRVDSLAPAQKPLWYVTTKSKSSPAPSTRPLALPHRSDAGSALIKPRRHKVDLRLLHEEESYLDEEFEIKVEVRNDEMEELDCHVDVELVETGSGSDGKVYDFLSCQDSKDPGFLKDLSFGTLGASTSGSLSFFLSTSQHTASRSINVTLKTRSSSAAASVSSEISKKIQLPVRAPFASQISPRWSLERTRNAGARRRTAQRAFKLIGSHSDSSMPEDEDDVTDSDDDEEMLQVNRSAKGSLCACFSSLASQPLEVRSISLKLQEPRSGVWFVPSRGEATPEEESVSGTWEEGDRYSTIHEIEALCDPNSSGESPSSIGFYEIKWRRAGALSSLESSKYFKTSIPLPSLLPPILERETSVFISPPSTARLNEPFLLPITICNPSSRSSSIQLTLESSESFIFTGPRSLSIPTLLAETERRITLRLMPIMVGKGKLPKIRAHERSQVEGQEKKLRVESSHGDVLLVL